MNQKDKERLVKSLNLLSSTNDGEVLGAARAAVRLLEKNNSSFDAVITVATSSYTRSSHSNKTRHEFSRNDWKNIANKIRVEFFSYLNAWEQDFITNLHHSTWSTVTPNQWKVLLRIARKMDDVHGV